MSSSLDSWNDTVGSKFSVAVNNVESYLRDAVKSINDNMTDAKNVMLKRVIVKSSAKEIKDLLVR